MKRGLTILLLAGLAFLNAEVCVAQPASQEDFNKMMETFLADDANLEKLGQALDRFFRKKRDEQRKAMQKAESTRMEDQFKNPVKIDIAHSPVKGSAEAPITIVEFSEFQCPFCLKVQPTLKRIEKEYGDKVNLVFKHLPLPFHQNARSAAQASIAAQKQGKFWEMHDLLFENQRNLKKEEYFKFAQQLGLDMEEFKADYESPETAKMIDQDKALAEKLGVRGTPGYFINGVQLRGAQPYPKFKEIIDRWLEKQKS